MLDPSRVEAVFNQALSLPTAARRIEYVEQACSAEPELRDRVLALLAAHESADPEFLGVTGAGVTLEPQSPVTEAPGTRIGRYRLLQQIGEGGFGVVFMAQQDEPVVRAVALKIIKLGMDTRQVVARFEAERQALAMMDHPNVAKVLDGGATETGRPYFVMELVKGEPINTFCDQHHLDVPARLELFMQVCHALQHAHQKGLIHRDLKPSNVLVNIVDDRPVAKVIDFGIAKAISQRLTEKTLFTEFRQLIGTPEYMSPEQAVGSLDIDTRSDVYSLGVLLYEILTGTPPFDPRELRSKAFEEMQRIIREVDPPNPSTRLSRSQTLASVAASRKTDPGKLFQSVRGELDWIVMKCLEKDRSRRYESAAALAADITHHLADQPINAGAPSRLHRARKFVRRHRGPVIATAAVAGALLTGIIGTTIGLIGEARQRVLAEQRQRESDENARQAKSQAAIAQAVGEFQADMLASADPERSLGEKVTVLQVVTAACAELDAGKLKDQPIVEANVRETIGNTLRSLGRYDLAEQQLRKALELRRKSGGPNDLSTAETLHALGIVLTMENKLDQAESSFREAYRIRQNAPAGPDPLAAASLRGIAGVMRQRGRFREAEPLLREALAGYRQALPPRDPRLAECVGDLGLLLEYQGRLAEAEPLLLEALEINRAAYPPHHPQISADLNNLALLQMAQQRFADAEGSYAQVLANLRITHPPGHPDIALALDNLAEAQWTAGKLEQAAASAREGLEIRKLALPPEHPDIAMSMAHLAMVLKDQGKLAEADPLAAEAVARCKKHLAPGDPKTANALAGLAELRQAQGRLSEAETFARESLALYEQFAPQGHAGRVAASNRLGGILLDAKHFPDAEAVFRKSLTAAAANPGQDAPGEILAQLGLALAIVGQHRHADAEAALLEAERQLAAVPNPPPKAIQKHAHSVTALIALYDEWDRAEPGKGYDAKAADWRRRQPATAPTTAQSSL